MTAKIHWLCLQVERLQWHWCRNVSTADTRCCALQAPFARYQLPAAAVQPPLLLAVSVAPNPQKRPQPKSAEQPAEGEEAETAQQPPDDSSPPEEDSSPPEESSSPPQEDSAAAEQPAKEETEVDAKGPQESEADVQQTADEHKESLALQPPDAKEHMLVVTIAVSPDLPGPLRGMCVDLDFHAAFGALEAVRLLVQTHAC